MQACVTPQIPSQRITSSTMASPPLPWSWMNFPRTWSLCYPLQTAACALTKGEKCGRNNRLLSELHSESILLIFLSFIFVLLQNAWGGEGRWVGQTERRYWGISAGAQERAGQTGWRTSSTVLQVSSVLISPNWSMKQTYDYNLKLILSACCAIVALPLELPFSVSVFKQPFININIKKYNCCN